MPVTVNENRAFGLSSKLNVLPSFDGTMGRVIGYGKTWGLPEQFRNILRKYGATLLMPGPAGILQYGFQPWNYRESTGENLAAVDQHVGLVVDAARVPGNNLVNPANWLAGSGTVISGGVATSTAVTAGVNVIQQDNIGVTGKMLEVTITITVVSGGAVIRPGGVNGPTITATGTYTQRLQAGAADAFRVIAGTSGFTGSITLSSISVRELPGIHASQPTSGFQPYLRQSGGVNSWQFDGVDDRLSLSAVPFQMSDNHFVVAGARSGGGIDKDIFSVRRLATTSPIVGLLRITVAGAITGLWRDDAASALVSVSVAEVAGVGVDVIGSLRQVGHLRQIRANGGEWASNTTSLGVTTVDSAAIGISVTTTTTNPMNGHIHGVIFGKGAISDSELLTLERFMASLQGRSL